MLSRKPFAVIHQVVRGRKKCAFRLALCCGVAGHVRRGSVLTAVCLFVFVAVSCLCFRLSLSVNHFPSVIFRLSVAFGRSVSAGSFISVTFSHHFPSCLCFLCHFSSARRAVVVDEAHRMRNKNSALLGCLQQVRAPCLLYTSPSPRDQRGSRMPSSA